MIGASLILTIAGLDDSGPGHWQTICEQLSPNCIRIELGMWDRLVISMPSQALEIGHLEDFFCSSL